MIFILSEEHDESTCDVINYLVREKAAFVRVNNTDRAKNISLYIDERGVQATLVYDFTTVSTKEITAYWYRRGQILKTTTYPKTPVGEISANELNRYLHGEMGSVFNAVNQALEKTPKKIGAFSKHDVEKLCQLDAAASCGLNIPASMICSTKAELCSWLKKYPRLATKGICKSFSCQHGEDNCYVMYTSIMDEYNSEPVPDVFFPTLFQEYQEKKYELRIFYLHGQFYAMAIFSQGNYQTQIDFRRYDSVNPNRNVPYYLPEHIRQQLNKTMKMLGLDTGSIDMLVTPEGEYIFLEVNPDGQFGMVSLPCNYFIERTIANFLST